MIYSGPLEHGGDCIIVTVTREEITQRYFFHSSHRHQGKNMRKTFSNLISWKLEFLVALLMYLKLHQTYIN